MGIDNLSSGERSSLPPEVELKHLDLRDLEVQQVVQEVEPDIVLHLAAQMSVAVSAREPMLDADINVLGSLNLLEGIRALKNKTVMFVHFSSGGTVYGEPSDLPADESTATVPLSPYAASKLAIETYLPIYERLCGLRHAVIRLGNVYGPRQDPHGEAGVVAIFTRAMLEGKPLKIFGTGTDQRDYVFIDDVVDAVDSVINAQLPGPFNIATGLGTDPNTIFKLLAELCDHTEPPDHVDPRPGDIERIFLDISKAKRELGWEPKVSLDEGLRRTVEWFRENYSEGG